MLSRLFTLFTDVACSVASGASPPRVSAVGSNSAAVAWALAGPPVGLSVREAAVIWGLLAVQGPLVAQGQGPPGLSAPILLAPSALW